MTLRRHILAAAALAGFAFAAPAVQAQPAPTLSPAFERAILAELNAATRAEVERRATAGNTVSGVIATTLLNDNQLAGNAPPGALEIVAVDFVRGSVVAKQGTGYRVFRFDPHTLRVLNEVR
jgi:hypothetical protein